MLSLASTAAGAPSNVLVIVGATLIDVSDAGRSNRDLQDSVIVIRDGLMETVGPRSETTIPEGRIIDGRGLYATPGLIDGFGAMRSQGFADAYLYEGVTTVLVTIAKGTTDGEAGVATVFNGPTVFRSETIVRATSDKDSRPTLEARTSVADSGSRDMRAILIGADVEEAQVAGLVELGNQRGWLVGAEFAATRYEDGLRAGVGVLIRNDHYLTALASSEVYAAYAAAPGTRAAGPAFRAVCSVEPHSPDVQRFARRLITAGAMLMPVLTVEATADDVGASNPWMSRSAVFVDAEDLDDPVDPLTGDRPFLVQNAARRDFLQACALRRRAIDAEFHRLGVRYLAGSGAAAFGIMPGGGLHQELQLLQSIGLTPREALAAATGNYGALPGWQDVGVLGPGRAGDVLLLAADPRLDVSALSEISMVIHRGRIVDRDALLGRVRVSARRLIDPDRTLP